MYTVTRKDVTTEGESRQTIASCMQHIARTMAELDTLFVEIDTIPDEMGTCMGCQKGWPTFDNPE